jgi:glycosyltransferase involved in cell wall biosynthesis
VCQHFWPESFRVNDIADFFIEKGFEIDVLCGMPNYPKGKLYPGYSYFRRRVESHNGISIRRALEITRGNNSNRRIFLNYISFPFFSLFELPHYLKRDYDKIIIYQLSPVMMALPAIILAKIKKIETTMYVLDLWPENLFSVLDIKNKILRSFVTQVSHWYYRRVDKLVVLSETMKTKIQDITQKPDSDVIVLPQASEKVYERDINNPLISKKFKNGFNILYAGNISPAQSFETIIAAAKQLKKADIDDINWIIVGDGMSRTQVEHDVARAGLSDIFYFEGQHPIDDIPAYNNVANLLIGCLVKSDLLEATVPAKVMSYIASGKPIVLAMDGEVQVLINDTIACGNAGPAGDADALYENIKKIYESSQSERIAMGKRARKYHFAHFERNIILTKLHDFMFGSIAV